MKKKTKTIKAWAIIGKKNLAKNLKIREYGALNIAILAIFNKKKQALGDCSGYEKVVPVEIVFNFS